MAQQFDLYRSRSGELMVIIQGDLSEALPTRVVAPCLRSAISADGGRLTPAFWFAEQEYRVMIPLLTAIRVAQLGTRLESVAHLREQIIRAVDLLLTDV